MVVLAQGVGGATSAGIARLVGRQLTLMQEMAALVADLRDDGRADLADRVQRLLDEAQG